MKAVRIHEFGSTAEVLQYEECQFPLGREEASGCEVPNDFALSYDVAVRPEHPF